MGERTQFYVISKICENRHITAIHDQWIYGKMLLKYSARLIDILRKTNMKSFRFEGEFDKYIQDILQVRFDDEGFYYHRVHIEDMVYSPDNADSNHGCIIIDMTGEYIRSGFYDISGNLLQSKEIASMDNSDYPVHEITDIAFDTLPASAYESLCAEMKGLAGNNDETTDAGLESLNISLSI
jgi:hypothetical protein